MRGITCHSHNLTHYIKGTTMKYKFSKFTHDISEFRRVNSTETTTIHADSPEMAWEEFCKAEADPDRIISTEIVFQEV